MGGRKLVSPLTLFSQCFSNLGYFFPYFLSSVFCRIYAVADAPGPALCPFSILRKSSEPQPTSVLEAGSSSSQSVAAHSALGSILFNVSEGLKRLLEAQKPHLGSLSKLQLICLTRCEWSAWAGLTDICYDLCESPRELDLAAPLGIRDGLLSSRYFLHAPLCLLNLFEVSNSDTLSYILLREDASGAIRCERTPLDPQGRLPQLSAQQRAVAVIPILCAPPAFPPSEISLKNGVVSDLCNMGELQLGLHAASQWQATLPPPLQLPSESPTLNPNSIQKSSLGLDVERPLNYKLRIFDPKDPRPTVCYALVAPAAPIRIDAAKAKALGVQGALLGKLSQGESVMSPSGARVTPQEVWQGVPESGPITLVLDCPTPAHALTLCASKQWSQLDFGAVACVAHLSPRSVMLSEEYSRVLDRLSQCPHHLFANELSPVTSPLTPPFPLSAALVSTLQSALPHRFALAPTLNPTSIPFPESILKHLPKAVPTPMLSRCVILPAKQRALIASTSELPKTAMDPFPLTASTSYPWSDEDVPEPQCLKTLRPSELTLHLLGTGAADPNRARNVTAALLRVANRGSMLLDCGAGTCAQLARAFDPATLAQVLLSLKVVWISHKHADHHCGLLTVLHERQKAAEALGVTAEQVIVIGPWLFAGCLDEMSLVLGATSSHRFVHSSQLCTDSDHLLSATLLELLGLKVRCIRVLHGGAGATAVRIEHVDSGTAIVVSGDSRPCPELIEIARNATLLVVEATFEDSDWTQALSRAHMCTSEALHVAAEAQVYRVLLTHFSQRRATLPLEDLNLPNSDRIDRFEKIMADSRAASEKAGKTLQGKMGDSATPAGPIRSPHLAQIALAVDLLAIDLSTLRTLPAELHQTLTRLKDATANLR